MKVVVLGDVITDKYIYGTSTRISPEAPVPIVNIENVKTTLGGAGLVSQNLKNLGVDGKKHNRSKSKPTPPIENTQTMCNTINNNILGKDNSAYTLLNKKITNQQRDALYKIVYEFYTQQNKRHPKIVKEDWQTNINLVNGSLNVLYQLIKIDGYDYAEIRDALRWGMDDIFYSKVLMSINSLRNKSKNGFSKFENLFHKYRNQ